jgi:hypothetical protein
LRRLTVGDAKDFHLMTNEPAIIDAIHFLAAPFTVADAQELRLCPAINESIGRDFCLAGFPSEWQGDSIFV